MQRPEADGHYRAHSLRTCKLNNILINQSNRQKQALYVHTSEHKHMHRNSSYLLSYIPIAGGSVLGGAHFWATHLVFMFYKLEVA